MFDISFLHPVIENTARNQKSRCIFVDIPPKRLIVHRIDFYGMV